MYKALENLLISAKNQIRRPNNTSAMMMMISELAIQRTAVIMKGRQAGTQSCMRLYSNVFLKDE